MNFIYRNNLNQTIRFTLGSVKYEVDPGSTVEIPEKYDYAIEGMGVKLEKDYEQSIFNDQLQNPDRWVDFATQSFATQSDGYGSNSNNEEKENVNQVKKDAKHSRAIRARKNRSI